MPETMSPTVAYIRAFRDSSFRLPTNATLIPQYGVIDTALAERIGGRYLDAHRAHAAADRAYTAELHARASSRYRQVCARACWPVSDAPSWTARGEKSERMRDSYWHCYDAARAELTSVAAQVAVLRQHVHYMRTALRFEACLDLPGCDEFSAWWRACPLRKRYLNVGSS